jgi:hypothetical protein
MARARIWLCGLSIAALGGLLFQAGPSGAGDDKTIKTELTKIAKALEKGNKDEAARLAQALVKKLDPDEGLHDVMHNFKPRSKKGWGVGSKAGVATPDGMELKLLALGRDAPSGPTLKREREALEEMSYVIAAIGEVAYHYPPKKDAGKKTKKEWLNLSREMRDSSLNLAAAVKSQGGGEVKTAAAKLNNSCNNCHTIFKEP